MDSENGKEVEKENGKEVEKENGKEVKKENGKEVEKENGKEVEKFLLNKLKIAMEQRKKADGLSNCLFKMDGFVPSFTSCHEYLSNDRTNYLSNDRKRENIYRLINLLSEWEMITQKHGLQYPEGLRAAYELKKKLKKLKKDVKPPGESTRRGSIKLGPAQDSTSLRHGIKNQDSLRNQHSSGKKYDSEQSAEVSTPKQEKVNKQDLEKNDASIFPDNLSEHRWSSRYRPSKVFGLEEKIRFMERLLMEDPNTEKFKAMAIFGIPGVGKTTICQVMYNHKKVKKYFNIRLWICLSKQKDDPLPEQKDGPLPEQKDDPDRRRKEVIKRILACLGIEEEVIQKIGEGEKGLRKLIITLRLQLAEKRYLIVLDDVSRKNDASPEDDEESTKDQLFFENLSSNSSQHENKLAYGLPKGEGSVVIVTTRSEELAKKMVGEEHVHHLPLLNKDLCWDIFKANLESGGRPFPEKLKDLKKLVIEKSSGLPLSASMMGVIMRERILEDEKKDETRNQPKTLRQVKSMPHNFQISIPKLDIISYTEGGSELN